MIDSLNCTARQYPRDASIGEIYRWQASLRNRHVALSCASEHLTYAEVDAITDRAALRLRARGIGRGSRVGILSERSLEPILAMLAILKAGAAYLPLPPQAPRQALARILTVANPVLILVQAGLEDRLETSLDCPVLPIETVRDTDISPGVAHWPSIEATDPAYVMFTSGSTGEPKGVAIGHRSVVNLAVNAGYAETGGGTVQLQLAPLAFDASTFEIWHPLLNGGRLVIHPERELSFAALEHVLLNEQVTTLWLTAGLFSAAVHSSPHIFRTLKCLLTGGDVVPVQAAARFLDTNPGCVLVNGYGPTECTTFSCCHIVVPKDTAVGPLPIGRPIANARAYVVDSRLQRQPPGTPGELCIAGDGVGLGYINSPGPDEPAFLTVDFGEGLI